MLGKILGAIIGSKIDRSDGEGGVKGAIIGAAAPGIIRRLGPLGLVLGGAWLVKRQIDKKKAGTKPPA